MRCLCLVPLVLLAAVGCTKPNDIDWNKVFGDKDSAAAADDDSAVPDDLQPDETVPDEATDKTMPDETGEEDLPDEVEDAVTEEKPDGTDIEETEEDAIEPEEDAQKDAETDVDDEYIEPDDWEDDGEEVGDDASGPDDDTLDEDAVDAPSDGEASVDLDNTLPDNDLVPFCGDGKHEIPNGLVLYLRMDEPASFGAAYDSSVSPLTGHGYFTQGALLGNIGIRGTALSFNKNSDFQVPDAAKLDLAGPMSLSAWINLPDNGSGNSTPYLVIGKGSGRQAAFYVWREADRTINFGFHTWELTGTGCGARSVTTPMDDGAWHHITGTYDGTYVRMYVDGVLETTSDPCLDVPMPNDHPVTIGHVPWTLIDYPDTYTGTGYIDEVRIYDRALSLSEIAALKNTHTEYCDDGDETITGDGCTNCQVDAGHICYGSPSTCILEPSRTCTHSVNICDSAEDYYDASYSEYYYRSWVGTTLQITTNSSVKWTSPSFSTYQWYEYSSGAKCWGTWYNYTFDHGQTVEATYTAKGAYDPHECYFQINDAPNGGGVVIATTAATVSGQWPANYSYTGTCFASSPSPFCGDGATQEGLEECDDNNTSNCDLCSSICKNKPANYCGDGYICGSEKCEGEDLNGKTCLTQVPGAEWGKLSCNGACDFVTTACSKNYTCAGKPSTGTLWNTVSSYVQTWNGSAWSPVDDPTTEYNPTASSTSCRYKCDAANGYSWSGSSCVK
ncbi:MAG TPA: DUF4215 domain-containing protein [bacterium]|nr:DUF4215 domain-containing protein [bacterium]